jgi:hypothetical protein
MLVGVRARLLWGRFLLPDPLPFNFGTAQHSMCCVASLFHPRFDSENGFFASSQMGICPKERRKTGEPREVGSYPWEKMDQQHYFVVRHLCCTTIQQHYFVVRHLCCTTIHCFPESAFNWSPISDRVLSSCPALIEVTVVKSKTFHRLRVKSLSDRIHGSFESDQVRDQPMTFHRFHQFECLLPFPTFHTRIDSRIKRDYIWVQPTNFH